MTDYADPVFPLPEPDFLWVYDMVVHQAGASVTMTAGRKWVNQSASAVFTGYIGGPNRREAEIAARNGVRIDATALAPHGTVIDEADDLEVPADPINPGSIAPPSMYVGRYSITAVRPNPSHARVLLTRIRGETPPHAG